MNSNERLLALLENYKLEELKKALQENVIEEHQKKSGSVKKDSSIINAMMKAAAKKAPYQKGFQKYHIWNNGGVEYKCLLDGYRVFASLDSFGYEPAKEHEKFKMDSIMMFDDFTTCIEVNRTDVSLFAKDHKVKAMADKPFVLSFENDTKYAAFNSHYLLDAIDFVGNSKLYFQEPRYNILKSPIILKSDDNLKYALILPVNIQDPEKSMQYMKSWKESYNNIAV